MRAVKLNLQFIKPAGDVDDSFLETLIAPFHHRLSAWGKDHSLMFMESIVHMACFPLASLSVALLIYSRVHWKC